MWDSLTVNGFSFDSSEEYEEAKKESEAIGYICAKMDISDPKTALKVYYKLLERKNLHTIIGFTFLKELRDIIISSGLIEPKNLKPILTTIAFTRPKMNTSTFGEEEDLNNEVILNSSTEADMIIPSETTEVSPAEMALRKKREEDYHQEKEKKLKSVIESYRILTKKCYIVIAAFVVIIIALFAITMSRGLLDMTKQESVIQDRYAEWAEELEAKEAMLNEREKALSGK